MLPSVLLTTVFSLNVIARQLETSSCHSLYPDCHQESCSNLIFASEAKQLLGPLGISVKDATTLVGVSCMLPYVKARNAKNTESQDRQ